MDERDFIIWKRNIFFQMEKYLRETYKKDIKCEIKDNLFKVFISCKFPNHFAVCKIKCVLIYEATSSGDGCVVLRHHDVVLTTNGKLACLEPIDNITLTAIQESYWYGYDIHCSLCQKFPHYISVEKNVVKDL